MLPFIPSKDFDDNDDEEEDRDDGFSLSDSPPLEIRGGSSVDPPLRFRLIFRFVLATRIKTYRPAKAVDAPNTIVAVFLEIISKTTRRGGGMSLGVVGLILFCPVSDDEEVNRKLPIHATIKNAPQLLLQ